jgi:hypothetical protein
VLSRALFNHRRKASGIDDLAVAKRICEWSRLGLGTHLTA